MIPFADPIVDTSALWKIILASLAGGAGCAIAFGIVLIGVSRAQSTGNGGVRAANYAVALVAGLFVIAAVVLGIHAITTKS
jgi:predicted RNase H-like nuclease (RuvC/YqgF family)